MRLNVLKYKQKTMLIRLIAYFILVTAITLAASSYITYSYFSSSFKNEIADFNHKVLNQVSILSDNFILKYINELAINQILDTSESQEIKAVFNSNSIDDWKLIFDAQYKLNNLVTQNSGIVDSIFIHSRKSRLLVSSSSKVVKYLDEESAKDSGEFSWISTFYKSNKSILWLKTRNAHVYSSGTKGMGDIITVICSYPASATGSAIEGFIAMNINEEALSRYLVKFSSGNSGQLMILDSDGSIVSHSDKKSLYRNIANEQFVKTILGADAPQDFKTTYNSTEYVVSYVKSNYSNWYYVSLVPSELFYQRDGLIKKNIFVTSVIILVIVLILSNILSQSIYTPFRKILDKYSSATGSGNITRKGINEYGMLDNLFSNMFTRLSDMQATINKNSMMIRHNFWVALLNNHYTVPENLENTLNLFDIKLNNKYYCAIVFTFDKNRNDIDLYKYNIIDYIDNLSTEGCIYIPVDIRSDSICVIINTNSTGNENVMQFVTKVTGFGYDKLGTEIVAGTGRFLEDLLSINKSYIDARMCLQYRFIHHEKNAFYYRGTETNSKSIPAEILEKFDKALKLGVFDEAKNILGQFAARAVNDNVPYRDVRHTMSGFITSYKNFLEIMNIAFEEITDEQDRKKLSSPININEFVGTFINVLQNTSNYICNKKHSKNAELANKIKQYVLGNLDQEISLNTTAEAFHISSFYLSKIFKDETGINYIDYVMSCKIDKAKNLLTSTSLSVDKITSLIGYSHATYFSRKFKEMTGKTPNAYRSEAHI